MQTSFRNLEYGIVSLICCIAYFELPVRLLSERVEVFTVAR